MELQCVNLQNWTSVARKGNLDHFFYSKKTLLHSPHCGADAGALTMCKGRQLLSVHIKKKKKRTNKVRSRKYCPENALKRTALSRHLSNNIPNSYPAAHTHTVRRSWQLLTSRRVDVEASVVEAQTWHPVNPWAIQFIHIHHTHTHTKKSYKHITRKSPLFFSSVGQDLLSLFLDPAALFCAVKVPENGKELSLYVPEWNTTVQVIVPDTSCPH